MLGGYIIIGGMEKIGDTIACISTPLVGGAISIVRVSGNDAVKVADKVFLSKKGERPSALRPRMLTLGEFDAGEFKEQCLCVVFKAPFSYTGEDMVEFQCHGGVMLTKGVLSALLKNGARMATAGEFSRRAFLNGKMSLSDAEGMMDMIGAESEAEIRAGYSLLTGQLSKKASSMQKRLVDLLSDIEVSLDYPEEDIEQVTRAKAKETLIEIKSEIEKQLDSREAGRLIKEGVSVAILGRPNVGKSSLLNALLKDERAIVTEVAGTTRDIIEGTMSIKGLKFNLFDTAGIRETEDKVEKIGVERAKKVIEGADIVVFVKDDVASDEDKKLEELIKGKKVIYVKNKADKTGDYSVGESINLSAVSGVNIDALTERLFALATEGKSVGGGLILTSERHIDALRRAKSHLEDALSSLESMPIDIVTIDINLAYQVLGEITGNTSSEEIIDAIFSKFCLGK